MPEVRWIVLASDGRHASVGRHTDPSPDDVARIVATLEGQGIGGWLCRMEGNYHSVSGRVTVLGVRALAGAAPDGNSWQVANRAFSEARSALYPRCSCDCEWIGEG